MNGSSDILISIKPKWCNLIFSGQKLDEIRKTRPKDDSLHRVYVWETGNGGIVGYFYASRFNFIQAWIDNNGEKHLGNTLGLRHCIDDEKLFNYLYREVPDGKPYSGGWAWRIKYPVRFDHPLDLKDFGLERPPQSWQYVRYKGGELETMNTMKPCPFCGCYMSIEIDRDSNGDEKIVPHGLHDGYCILKAVTWHTYPENRWTPEQIIALWNRRASL